ncbi:MAG: hypothetical protein J0L89_03835 [Xanthomonadales bacterium]|nr:hypothetical protein [Xanthomonadales bacterium]MCA0196937.1 hypothetical protein [Pseudomonadota bacterium]
MLNKKLLAVAIVGTLVAGNAAAANLSASGGAIPAIFAKEIVVPSAGIVLNSSGNPAADLTWNVGYNFSAGEVRYARLECSNTIKFAAGTAVTLSDPAAGNVGSLNGLNTNTVTFSITSVGGPANNVLSADTLLVTGAHTVTSTATPVNCSVGLYDQPSQAQAGGTTGLIAGSYFSGPYLTFAQSYQLTADPTVHTADVESDPSFSEFVPDSVTGTDVALLGAYSVGYGLRDPDGTGAQTATFRIDGNYITMADLFAATTTITAAGDFTPTRNANGTYTGAALGRAWLNGNANLLTATSARFPVGNAAFGGLYLYLWNQLGHVMSESAYTLTLNPVAASAAYAPTAITNVLAGEIVRNGTELQAPLAQVPGGWLSRLVLTNTGGTDRGYEVTVQTEVGTSFAGPAAADNKLTGVIPAGKTVVIDDISKNLLGAVTGNPRATLIVTVAGPNNQIQGLYQIVNPDKGSISNHVLVRPGTN